MRRAAVRAAGAAAALLAFACGGFLVLDRLMPPDVSRLAQMSTIVVDRNGATLRAFKTGDGQWRLPVALAAVSPAYLYLLVDVEDRRFFAHPGVDPLALVRAAGQVLTHGRVVSGGSTLTMQVARLLEPRPRTLRSKLIEMFRAIQLERRLGKPGILQAYLALAPMGGNLQGVRAGSLAWLGKEPAALSDAEAALLVALPQSPTRLRPDAAPQAATRARAKILARGLADGLLAKDAVTAALATPLPARRGALPVLAPHLAERLAAAQPLGGTVPTSLDAGIQAGAERVLRLALDTLPRPVNLAAIVADWRTGEILARVGSADYFDARRSGMVDMTRAVRSPGSTLKPFIYGMAFDGLLAHPASLVRDEASRFDDYAPHNFDGGFNGDVTIRKALQWSLNLPAVVVLQRLGPVFFTQRLREAGIPLVFSNPTAAPSLPIALGGVGTTLDGLVAAYAGLADGGRVKPLTEARQGAAEADAPPVRLLEAAGADAVVDILSDMPPPDGFGTRAGTIAYKTGTSYRFRDGWAVGFDGSRVIGVWMGRADGAACPCVGAAAAGLLYRLFDTLPRDPLPRRMVAPVLAGPPPPALLRIQANAAGPADDAPHITFPLDQSRLLVDAGADSAVKLAAEGGQRPYRWLVDGVPVDSQPFARQALWHARGAGFSTVTVVDMAGRSADVQVRLVERDQRQAGNP